MSPSGGCGTAPSAVVSSADEPPGRSDLSRRRTLHLQVRATEHHAEAGRGRRSGLPQVKPTILILPRPWGLPTGKPCQTAVGLTVGTSKQNALLRRLAEELPALLRRRQRRSKPAKPRQRQR